MTQSPHDAFFKAVFSQPENAVGEFKAVLPPALVGALDLATAHAVPGSFVDEHLSARHTDLLYEVKLAERDALLYVLFEHQSSVDPLLPVRLLVYVGRVLDDWVRRHEGATRVPPVIPVVLYHGATAWTAATELLEVYDVAPAVMASVREHLPSFRFVLDDLTTRTDAELRAREAAALGRLALVLLRHVRDLRSHPERLGNFLASVADLVRALSRRGDRVLSFCYILEVVETDARAVSDALGDVSHDVREDVMTAADQLRREGRLQGVLQGERRVLLRQLRARFGQVSPAAEQKIMSADEAILDRWTERVLTAKSVEDALAATE